MRAIRIVFQTIENDGSVGLVVEREVSAISLKQARVPLLPLVAEEEARKFWVSIVLMGKVET